MRRPWNWWRRLQPRSATAALRNPHQVAHLATATRGRDRLRVAHDYLRKVAKDADEVGDLRLSAVVDARCDDLADRALAVVAIIEGKLAARGYYDD